VPDFVHGIAAAFAFEQEAGDSDDEAENVTHILVGMNHAARDVDARRGLGAGVDDPALGGAGGAGAVVPEINPEIRWAGEVK